VGIWRVIDACPTFSSKSNLASAENATRLVTGSTNPSMFQGEADASPAGVAGLLLNRRQE